MNLNDLSSVHQSVIDSMKDQLLIVLIRRLGGNVTIPVSEVDDTAGVSLHMQLTDNNTAFRFEVKPK